LGDAYAAAVVTDKAEALADYNQAFIDFCAYYNTDTWEFRKDLLTGYPEEVVEEAERIMNTAGGAHAALLSVYGKLDAGRFDASNSLYVIIAGTYILRGSIENMLEVLELSIDPLAFDAEASYLGRYSVTVTVNGHATASDLLVFDSYRVTYVKNPFIFNGTNISTMNIKVPVSLNGVPFENVNDAPILMYNPWGGDNGSAPPSSTTVDTTGFSVKRRAMAQGWVLIEPGMRGQSHYVGTIGAADYYNYGKLPWPIVDLKASIRYLRHGANASLIPGDKEKIFFTGTSSGGCATTMIASSGNTHEYDTYLVELGAAMDARDDVFAGAACCPIITRDWAEASSFWQIWGTKLPYNAPAYNFALTNAYQTYQNNLGLTATVNGVPNTPLTDFDTYTDFLMGIIKRDMVKFLNHISRYGLNNAPGAPGTYVTGTSSYGPLTGRAAIDAYLASTKPNDSLMGTPYVPTRSWINPVFDPDDPSKVIDVLNTYEEYLLFTTPTSYVSSNPYNVETSTADRMLRYEGIDGNGAVQSASAPNGATGKSIGLPTDFAAVFSDFAWDYLSKARGIDVPEAYKEMVRFQRDSTDPMHFVLGSENVDIAPNWFIRTGANDTSCKLPIVFNLVTALDNRGYNVNGGITWDQAHAYTQDVVEFIDWANEILAGM
jgi:hypothetical protein